MSLVGSNIATADIPVTTTTLSCAATTVAVNSGVVCTATVSVPNADGLYTWTTSGVGEFIDATPAQGPSAGECATYVNGACSMTFVPLSYTGQTVTITASFGYDDSLGASSNSVTLNLTPASSTTTTASSPTTTSTQATTTSTPATTAATTVSIVTSTQTVTTSTSSMSGYEDAGLVVVVLVLLAATFFIGRRGRTPSTPAKSM